MPQSGNRRVASKMLTLGALLTCLFVLYGPEKLAQRREAATPKAVDTDISVLSQPDAPLRLAVLSHNPTDPLAPEIVFQLTNVGGKPVRAYVVVQETMRGGERSTGFTITDIDSTNGTLQPGQYLTDAIAYAPLAEVSSRVTLSLDMVEYGDGTLWGADTRKSAEVLSGRRAGAREAQRRVLGAYRSAGLSAAMRLLQTGPADGEPPADGSAVWREGYRHGFSYATGRLRRMMDVSGERQLEAELRRLSARQ